MSITEESAQYFEKVAGKWDEIRSTYFTQEVRQAAIRKAYLRPEMVVADVGAGTGFMSAGLAPLVRRVYAIDASPAMLEVARQNLQAFPNLFFQESDGLSLPLPDESLDAVFANMYLHHCPDPASAVREMVRVLRPGGRLVVTDMDAHPYAWLKDEMADVWQGFERLQVRDWFQQAGLVNVIVDCTGQSCCAQAQDPLIAATSEREAKIGIFVAAGTRRVSGVREAVQAGYSAAAQGQSSCCSSTDPSGGSSSCCSSGNAMDQLISIDDNLDVRFIPDYSASERAGVPAESAEIALGCGNPTAMASLKPGETVLDIGSGGGMDAFLAAGKVGPAGRVIGVDMTPAMLERARAAAQKGGFTWVEFRQGQAEALPVDDAVADVVISNCVINLCEDKGVVFREAYRVLKAGGRLEVSDVVTGGQFPLALLENPEDWPGCVFGALPEQEYVDLVKQAGFTGVKIRRSASTGQAYGVNIYSVQVSAVKPRVTE
jgi:arsenite methyltransferase